MIIGKKGQNINWVRDHFKTNYAKIYQKEVEVHVRVTIRKETMMREQEEIESSYYKQKVKQDMRLIEQTLNKEGKLITKTQ
jgi:GTPase Era involved in 16S rRNA processing